MGTLQQNIQLIRKAAKSRPKLAAMLNKNFSQEFHFTENQLDHYENDRTQPDENFKKRLAELAGVTVNDLEKRKLKPDDIKFVLRVPDSTSTSITNQIEIISRQRVILSILADLQAPLVKKKAETLRREYEESVRETEKKVAIELRMKP